MAHCAIIIFTSFSHLGAAEVCFEPFSGDPVPVTEMQGSVCVNVVRDVSDSDVFLYRAVSAVNLDADRTALGTCTMCMYIQLAGTHVIHMLSSGCMVLIIA